MICGSLVIITSDLKAVVLIIPVILFGFYLNVLHYGKGDVIIISTSYTQIHVQL